MMRIYTRAVVLIGVLAMMGVCGIQAVAQLATTAIVDTVYRADGMPAGGTVLISWNAFTSSTGAAIAAGNTAVTLGSGGSLSVSLSPNSGGTPMGTYYTAVFHLNDGTTMRQFWSVPAVMAGAAPVKLAAISATVLPSSVAMQTVSKQYVDNAIASAEAETSLVPAARLPIFGPSGTTHAPGAVPDPGATAGSTRFLNEDGTWEVPASGGSGGSGSFSSLAVSGTTAVTVSNTTASSAVAVTALCPNLPTGSVCLFGVGKASSAGNEGFFGWQNATTPFFQVQTYNNTSPVQFGGSAINTTAALMVNNGAAVNTLGPLCSAGVSLCVNSGSTFTVDTSGRTTTPQIVASGAAPTMIAGAAAGSSPSCTTVTGANMAGVLTCVTGSGPAANATLATISFNGGVATAPQGCRLMARNAAAASEATTIYTTGPTTTGWSIGVGGSALTASTTYSWSYSCM